MAYKIKLVDLHFEIEAFIVIAKRRTNLSMDDMIEVNQFDF